MPRGDSFMQLSRMEIGEMAARQFTGVLIPTGVQAPHQSYSFCTSGIRDGILCSVPGARKGAENASHFKHFTIAFSFKNCK